MSGFDGATVAYHVRRLDAAGLAALVADLWDARGYETTREGGDVLASDGTATIRIRIAPGTDAPSEPLPDVVVVPGGVGNGNGVFTPDSGEGDIRGSDRHGGARVVDAAALAEMIGYAVDRQVARDICARHFGTVPADLPPPPLTRLRQQVGTLGSGPVTAVLALGVGAVIVVLLVGGVAGVTFLSGSGGEAATVNGQDSVTETTPQDGSVTAAELTGTDGDERASAVSSDATSLPPGVTGSGIEDIDALAAAHERAVANRSHTIWVDWYRPRNLRPNGTRIQRDIDIAAEGDRYLIETSEEVGGDRRTRTGALYHDGSILYVAVWNETSGSYGRVFSITPRQNRVPTPESVRSRVVTRYLSTPTTNVTGVVERNGQRLYRVVGSGRPNSSSAVRIRNYSVEALVDSRGFVRDVTVRALVSHPDADPRGAFRVEREITYGRVGATTVEPPAWYENHTAGG